MAIVVNMMISHFNAGTPRPQRVVRFALVFAAPGYCVVRAQRACPLRLMVVVGPQLMNAARLCLGDLRRYRGLACVAFAFGRRC